jgi:small subunit ribosomal protein S17
MATETQPAATDTRGERTVLTGKVTSAKMEKTIVVEVLRLVQHPKYRRVVRIAKKFYAHDEKRQAKAGDTVRIVASRPMSKLKRWRLKEVLASSASAKQ